MIPHNRPCITAEDRAAVDAVLASGWIARGPVVAALERALAGLYGAGSACAVSSGTAALYLAIRAIGLEPRSAIAVPSYACVALLNAVHMAGCTPRVLDVRPDTFCIDAHLLPRQAPDARLAIAVHCFGATADVMGLEARGCAVIADCCQSLGGIDADGPSGCHGRAAVFSLYATKIITAGQGGLVWSREPVLIDRIRDYLEFDGRETYAPRFNFQMTDIQAALALSQFERLSGIRNTRARICSRYREALPDGLGVQAATALTGRMMQRFAVVAPDRATRDRLWTHLGDAGIGCAVPIQRFELLHRYLGLDPDDYPASEALADTVISLPLHVGLAEPDIAAVCQALSSFKP